jgi:hypothetical protein
MTIRRQFVPVLPAILMGLMATSGYAVSASRTTYLTFSGPVALPGVTLPAGTYTFERANPDGDVHVVRVSSRDQRTVYLLAFTHLIERPDGLPTKPARYAG